jgi:hypothetical protein
MSSRDLEISIRCKLIFACWRVRRSDVDVELKEVSKLELRAMWAAKLARVAAPCPTTTSSPGSGCREHLPSLSSPSGGRGGWGTGCCSFSRVSIPQPILEQTSCGVDKGSFASLQSCSWCQCSFETICRGLLKAASASPSRKGRTLDRDGPPPLTRYWVGSIEAFAVRFRSTFSFAGTLFAEKVPVQASDGSHCLSPGARGTGFSPSLFTVRRSSAPYAVAHRT